MALNRPKWGRLQRKVQF